MIIYNSLGQIISKPINSNYSAGNHSLTINADDIENGIYTYWVTQLIIEIPLAEEW